MPLQISTSPYELVRAINFTIYNPYSEMYNLSYIPFYVHLHPGLRGKLANLQETLKLHNVEVSQIMPELNNL